MLVYEQAGSGDILSSFQVSCCMQVVSSLSPPRPTAVTLKSLFRRLSHHHPKVNVFLFAALESIADMLCSSICMVLLVMVFVPLLSVLVVLAKHTMLQGSAVVCALW
jgi:hypothetical protein